MRRSKMELKELLEAVYKEAYKLGKEDGLNGLHISSSTVFEQFWREQEHQINRNDVLVYLQNLKSKLNSESLH